MHRKLVRAPERLDFPLTLFPHWAHRIRFKCYVCHDAIFQMRRGAETVTMDDIVKGKACGICHDDARAFAVTFFTCARCHPGGLS